MARCYQSSQRGESHGRTSGPGRSSAISTAPSRRVSKSEMERSASRARTAGCGSGARGRRPALATATTG